MKLFVYDPGVTTGLVTAEVDVDSGARVPERLWLDDVALTMELEHVKAPTEVHHVIVLWRKLCEYRPTHVVGEDFVLLPPKALKGRAHSSDRRGLTPTRILLGMDLMLTLEVDEKLDDEKPFNLSLGDRQSHSDRGLPVEWMRQMPGERMVVTDEFLRENQLWRTPKQIEGAVTGDSNHAMDALRHLIVYVRKVNEGKK